MKKIIALLIIVLFTHSSIAQLDFTMTGLYSSPLHQFCVDDYKDGWGAKFGLGYTTKYSEKNGVELGFNWLFSNNGYKKTELEIGDYTIKNNWYNWQFKLNHVWDKGVMNYYAGLNAGRGIYYSSKFLDYKEPLEGSNNDWNDQLYSKSVFQYGAQAGTYIKLNDIMSFDLGISVLKSDQEVNYVNLESYIYDEGVINCQEPTSSPFLVTISAGFRINLSKIDWSNEGTNLTDETNPTYEKYADYEKYASLISELIYYSQYLLSTTSSKTKNSRSSKRSSRTPKLYKNGKTPVVFK